jgi:uncharacterized protein YbjQ (UPF0145 family)
MIISTTPHIEGRRILKYIGIVSGDCIIGANMIRDLWSGWKDLVGGRVGTYEKVIMTARNNALKDMTSDAVEAGANAIVGVDFDYEVLGSRNGMLMVSVTGTAVVVE